MGLWDCGTSTEVRFCELECVVAVELGYAVDAGVYKPVPWHPPWQCAAVQDGGQGRRVGGGSTCSVMVVDARLREGTLFAVISAIPAPCTSLDSSTTHPPPEDAAAAAATIIAPATAAANSTPSPPPLPSSLPPPPSDHRFS